MQDDVREVKSVNVAVPKKIIRHERNVLHRPVLPPVGIKKKVMTESFENKERTLDERIVAREKIVIPGRQRRESRGANRDAYKDEQQNTQPVATQIIREPLDETTATAKSILLLTL